MEGEIIFKTMIGSNIWKMNHAKSDEDYFEVRQADSADIFRGKRIFESSFQQKDNTDTTIHEIGNVVEQLLKGNYNYIVGVMSPILIYNNGEVKYQELQRLVSENISKNCYNSINGMCVGNFHKYVERWKTPEQRWFDKIGRTLEFGITLLNTGKFEFKPVSGYDEERTRYKIAELKTAFENSKLPETMKEEPFRDFLYRARYENLMGRRY
jgi:predicted nucleotidyltransferase